MIKAIFFAIFDNTEGPKVLHQVPPDSITASPSSPTQPLINFAAVSSLVIPRPEFCSRLIQFTHNGQRILCYPIHLSSASYTRNAFLFSFALVLAEETPFASYTTVALKLANVLRTLEEQSRFLSRDTSAPNTGKIYALCEVLMEDLNNYCETQIPIDDSNTLNVKLFPTYPPPPPVLPHHVPLSTVRLQELVDDNWDLTMLSILPYIDGVNSVKQISLRADADYKLTRKAIRHLLYYGCLLLLDVFQFGAIYAPTAEIAGFVDDEEVQEECARYVTLPPEMRGNDSNVRGLGEISGTRLVELYLALRQGLSVKSWYAEHEAELADIDVRRFITFGVIKGFLYRVHKYAFSPAAVKQFKSMNKKRGLTDKGKSKQKDKVGDSERKMEEFLDGTHCFDEICTEFMISERELVGRLKDWGDVQIIHR